MAKRTGVANWSSLPLQVGPEAGDRVHLRRRLVRRHQRHVPGTRPRAQRRRRRRQLQLQTPRE